MDGKSDLRDALHREMVTSNRSWSSEEIARTALKIVSDPGRADRLVAAILACDPRFRRDGSAWTACAKQPPRLKEFSFLLAEIPPVPRVGIEAPLFVQPYEIGGAPPPETVRVEADGSGLEHAAVWLDERLCVSLSAPAVRRRLHRMERLRGLPAVSDRLLDLASVLRSMGEGMPASCLKGCGEPVEERLLDCRASLERVLEMRGDRTLEALETDLERGQRLTPVDFSGFSFGREVVGLLPDRPGLYRFRGEDGRLLYVGKSRDLRRRVAGYFRPLAPDHARRARLVQEIRDLEWETTPSELEALVLEAEAIRKERPPYNQQVELHPSGERVPARDADLAFVLCEGDEEEVSVFFLREGRAWARARLPRGPLEEAERSSRAQADAWLTGACDRDAGLVAIEEPEGLLVLRYLTLYHDRLDRIRASDVSGPEDAASALALLALRPRPAWEPWTLRSPARR